MSYDGAGFTTGPDRVTYRAGVGGVCVVGETLAPAGGYLHTVRRVMISRLIPLRSGLVR